MIAATLMTMLLSIYTDISYPVTISEEVPDADTSFKVYMDYRTLTDQSSKQWEMQQEAHTDEEGFRKIDDYYLVAMGTYYTEECGAKYKITLEGDYSFNVMVGDIKHPDHTDESNRYHEIKDKHGNLIYANVLEFIVDTDVMDENILKLGDCSSAGFEGKITKIERIIYK